ncbi:MAG: polyprenyl synthetase family protein [Lachnospiraceae bacterium]
MKFKEELATKTAQTETVIEQFLPKEEGFAARLAEAMNYSMRAGGKHLRPIFLKEAYVRFGGTDRVCEPFMAAIEMIHTHSLIHDDLPAIDNDALRRGKPTTHAAYGEALGILSGDALLNLAYETAIRAFNMTGAYERVAEALRILAEKTGMHGMLGGQSVDVMNDGKPLSKELLDYIYEHKTSRLIEAPLMIGAVLAGADKKDVQTMERIGYLTGIAFQIEDDILDVTSTAAELGKPIHSDEKNHKVTYVTLQGLEGAKREARRLSDEAIALLGTLPGENVFLTELIQSLTERKR